MLKSLAESAARFEGELSPLGYEMTAIRWVIDIDPESGVPILLRQKDDLVRAVPIRGDRSGKASGKNSKPALLVDRASYALGVSEPGKEASVAMLHKSFRRTLEDFLRPATDAGYSSGDSEAFRIMKFLDAKPHVIADTASQDDEAGAAVWKSICDEAKPSDMVAFRSNSQGEYPFEQPAAYRFWERLLRSSYTAEPSACAVCGEVKAVLRILPWQVSIAGQSCPISSFNGPAFESFGKEQLANSPICFDCGGVASQVLQHLLVKGGRHNCFLAQDDAKGKGRSPLKNHVAVFWLREKARLPDPTSALVAIDLDEVLSAPLRSVFDDSPPPEVAQLERLLSMPWNTAKDALRISQNSFFLAVLSPNKSRLVVREWIEESIERVWKSLAAYEGALRITDPAGERAWAPSIGAIFAAFKPEGVASATSSGDLLRGLLRTAYKGTPTPVGLLALAVRRFRVPDKTKGKKRKELQDGALRRMALAAAMKLVLISGYGKVEIMEELNDGNESPPYLCGRLLAILEQAQLRAANWRISATLVDRCYGGASTSPNSTFGSLLSLATKAHFPKLKKAYGGVAYRELEPMLEDVLSTIRSSGGFPSVLNLREQAEFALGFYQQRACFRKERAAAQLKRTLQQTSPNPIGGENDEPHGSR